MAPDLDKAVSVRYRVGIDVGTHSTGFCAVEVDENDRPVSLLNSMVFIHDAGIDPTGAKAAQTRKAVSGVARRTRRLIRRRKQRLQALDTLLEGFGYPLVDLESDKDPLLPWRVRSLLAAERIEDQDERKAGISIAVRHIARHRGWRSPYSRVESLLAPTEYSDFYRGLFDRVSERLDGELPEGSTPGQIIAALLAYPWESQPKLRGPEGVLHGKLMQSDNANELHRIAEVQGIPDAELDGIIRQVFHAKSPVGSAAGLVGRDALPGQGGHRRAEKAHPEFLRFRMLGVLTNLRIDEGGVKRRLNPEELRGLVDYLQIESEAGNSPSWGDLADNLGVERSQLVGTAKAGPDGEPSLAAPPLDVTSQRILSSKIPWLKKWWKTAPIEDRGALIDAFSTSGGSQDDNSVNDEIVAFLEQATEEDHEKLDGIDLPQGRAAYSLDSLRKMNQHMLETGDDVYETRSALFNTPADWAPPAERIGAPVGNPAVDRVLKQVARWLAGVERQWGTPLSVNIEHVRNGLGSEKAIRDAENERKRREKANEALIQEMYDRLGIEVKDRRAALIRYKAFVRQNGACLYCGAPITYDTLEMDHIVPRANGASTNTMTNLAAVCGDCNSSKNNTPFAEWASSESAPPGVQIEEVEARVRMWLPDSGMNRKSFAKFQTEVIRRLKSRQPDQEIDARSLESVAWMANELRHRIEQHFRELDPHIDVRVYSGMLTAEARKADDFEDRVKFVGGGGKTRFDRRHHAMDALVIALMNPSVAQTIAWRMNKRMTQGIVGLRKLQEITGVQGTWKTWTGKSGEATRKWDMWVENMLRACELFNIALAEDQIPILQNKRLRLGSSTVHEATINKFNSLPLGAELPADIIDRAATPALWCALTRHPDFSWENGLPEDPNRTIMVNGTRITAAEKIDFFPSNAAYVSVRGGCALLGDSIHHARIYRIEGRKPTYAMLRVFQVDLNSYRGENLFEIALLPQSISVRTAEPKLRQALTSGSAVQIGWLVEGDELLVNPKQFTTGMISDFLEEYPVCLRWRVAGFPAKAKLRLKPLLLSPEGIDEGASKAVNELVSSRGWWPAVNKLLECGGVTVIRRTALGVPRTQRDSSLPPSQALW